MSPRTSGLSSGCWKRKPNRSRRIDRRFGRQVRRRRHSVSRPGPQPTPCGIRLLGSRDRVVNCVSLRSGSDSPPRPGREGSSCWGPSRSDESRATSALGDGVKDKVRMGQTPGRGRRVIRIGGPGFASPRDQRHQLSQRCHSWPRPVQPVPPRRWHSLRRWPRSAWVTGRSRC